MRPTNGYIERYKKNKELAKQEQNTVVDWDFVTNGVQKPSKNFPITLDQSDGENEIQKFERYIRQLGRSILACSLCDRGCSMMECGHVSRIPHFQPSIWYKNYMLIKNKPDCNDIGGLFNNKIDLIKKNGLSTEDFYKTTIIKCSGDDDYTCPYFKMEWEALSKCRPTIVICFDEESSMKIGAKFVPRKLQKIKNYKIFCVESDDDFNLILKVIHQQIHNHQTS